MRISFDLAGEKSPGVLSTLSQSSANALRLALFQQIAADRFKTTWWQVAAFGVASLLIPVLFDLAWIGINGEFNRDAIPSAIAHLPIILFAAIVTAYVLRSSEKTLFILQAFLMIAAAIDLVVYSTYFAAVALYPQPWPYQINVGYHVVPPIWLALACARPAAGPLAGEFQTQDAGLCRLLTFACSTAHPDESRAQPLASRKQRRRIGPARQTNFGGRGPLQPD